MYVLAFHLFRGYKRHVRWQGTNQRHKYTCNFSYSKFDKEFSSRRWLQSPVVANWIGKKTFQKIRLTYKVSKLNVLIRDKISFVGVVHLTRGGRSCLWALYRCTCPFFVMNRCLFNVKTVRNSTWTSFGCVEVDSRVVSLFLGCGDKYYVLNTALPSIDPSVGARRWSFRAPTGSN